MSLEEEWKQKSEIQKRWLADHYERGRSKVEPQPEQTEKVKPAGNPYEITLVLSPAKYDQIKAIAQERNKTLDRFMSDALEFYIANY
jgi:hypothetical protein